MKPFFFILYLTFFTLLLTEISLYIFIDKNQYEQIYRVSSLINKYRRAWYGDNFAKNDCLISKELTTHPHLAFLSKPSKNCNIPVTDAGTHGNRNFKEVNLEADNFNILLIGGSAASHFGALEKNNPIELELNRSYFPPTGKKKFIIYNGSHPSWKMPSTTLMGLMYQEKFDSIVFLDGFNEFQSIFFEKNIWMPSEYTYASASEPPFPNRVLSSSLRDFFISLYTNYPILQNMRLLNLTLKILIQQGQKLHIHYIPYGQGISVDELSTHYINHVKTVLGLKNSFVFFQPTAIFNKTLTKEEIKGCESMCDHFHNMLYEKYSELNEIKSRKLKLKNFFNLTKIFNKNAQSIYFDSVHFKNSDKDIGMKILAIKIVQELSTTMGFNKK